LFVAIYTKDQEAAASPHCGRVYKEKQATAALEEKPTPELLLRRFKLIEDIVL
jgi:hypothetical protein